MSDDFKDLGEMAYNSETGVLKVFIRGRPVHLHAPSQLAAEYDVSAEVSAPQEKLTIEWVYGYRGKDCRNNVFLLPTGEVVYFVAAVAVLYGIKTGEQRHYTAHTDDIKCMAVHPNRCIIATGQCAGTRPGAQPQVHVWDSVSLNTVRVLDGEFARSLSCLAFSAGACASADAGALLACIDDGPHDRVLSVWRWNTAEKLVEAKASADTVVDVQWHPLDTGVLISCGRQHVCFWLLEMNEDGGANLQRRQGVFGARDRPKYVSCVAFSGAGDLVTGDSDGRLLVWQRGGNQVARTVRDAHEGAIFSLHASRDGHLISAGKDGAIVEWDADFNRTGNTIQVPEELGAPRVVAPGRNGQLIIGTLRNCIALADWSADGVTSDDAVQSPLVVGHTDEVWATAAHPSGEKFVTGAWDGQLVLWHSGSHTVLWRMNIQSGVQSCDFSPSDARLLVVGCVDGNWHVIDIDAQRTLFQHKDGDEPLQVVRFSPDGTTLALGSRNNTIYLYQAAAADDNAEAGHMTYERSAKCTGHSSYITHVDWTEDSGVLRSNSGDYELLYWTAADGRQLTSVEDVRDASWATHTCPLTFNTIGIFPAGADGTDVNTCAATTLGSNNNSVLASGDDHGRVKLFPFPACHPRTHYHSHAGHSSHVTCVRFLGAAGGQLLSAGGHDTAIIQWNVE